MILIPSLVILLLSFLMIQSELINDPTIKPSKDFSAKADAEVVAAGDKKKIAHMIFHRTYDERKKIQDYYEKNIGPQSHLKLMDALKATADRDRLKGLYGMVLEPAEEILASSLHDNINQSCPEIGALEEIVCANDKEMKDRINKKYQAMYGKPVEEELSWIQAQDQDYQKAIVKYCWKGLCQDQKITPQDVDKEAQALRDIHPKKQKPELKNKLIELLDKYCEPDLKKIFQKYRKDDNGIDDAVNDSFEIDGERRAYYYLVRSIEDICKLYAFELRHAADDATDIHTDKINRIVLSRCERDLFCIQKAYHDKGYATFTARLAHKSAVENMNGDGEGDSLYTESMRYLLGKP